MFQLCTTAQTVNRRVRSNEKNFRLAVAVHVREGEFAGRGGEFDLPHKVRGIALAVHRVERGADGKEEFIAPIAVDVGGDDGDAGVAFETPFPLERAGGGV